MLYTYTPESVGGTIICEITGHYYKEEFTAGDQLICIYRYINDDFILIKVYENTKTVRVVSTIELEFKEKMGANYYYPVKKYKGS